MCIICILGYDLKSVFLSFGARMVIRMHRRANSQPAAQLPKLFPSIFVLAYYMNTAKKSLWGGQHKLRSYLQGHVLHVCLLCRRYSVHMMALWALAMCFKSNNTRNLHNAQDHTTLYLQSDLEAVTCIHSSSWLGLSKGAAYLAKCSIDKTYRYNQSDDNSHKPMYKMSRHFIAWADYCSRGTPHHLESSGQSMVCKQSRCQL